MSVSDFLAARADDIIQHAMSTMGTRRLDHYERLGEEASAEQLRAFLRLIIEAARTRDLVPVIEHAERVGRERYESGFEFVEVQGAMNLLEEAIWRELLKLGIAIRWFGEQPELCDALRITCPCDEKDFAMLANALADVLKTN